jgi:hypothetical protein
MGALSIVQVLVSYYNEVVCFLPLFAYTHQFKFFW